MQDSDGRDFTVELYFTVDLFGPRTWIINCDVTLQDQLGSQFERWKKFKIHTDDADAIARIDILMQEENLYQEIEQVYRSRFLKQFEKPIIDWFEETF
ncbi:hypothetical protein Dfri01_59120 [Dyadobacter frigoris]|uniref:hypothetical protein n=1 Tax=Dyadobacter frigoris TaxID=2576211 RepID=UPI0024A0ABC0|nr:hypothetical protein [Dyadobacter frigoris]GLU56451.1 hypothetical protein Dfri01_59120 [Dyadobacter frigoris]